MKKLVSLALTGLALSSWAQAADIVPTVIYPVQEDLARSYLRLQNDWDLRLGFGFSEAERFVLNPTSRDAVDSSSVRRSITATLRLPKKFELGLVGTDGEESTSSEIENIFGKNDGKKTGAAIWLRSYLVQTETFSTAIVAQFEPGMGNRRSFDTPSQDKTSLALTVDYSPSAYAHLGAYVGGSTRNKEKYFGKRLNDEILYGTRLAAGPSLFQLFVDAEFRAMPWKTETGSTNYRMSQFFETGIAANYKSLSFQASTFVPGKERFIGIPERGFSVSVQYVIGKTSSSASEASKSPAPKADAPKAGDKEAAPAIKSQDNLEDLITPSQDQELAPLGSLPDTRAEMIRDTKPVAPITTSDPDEFQKWEELSTKEAKLRNVESATERKEREFRAQAIQEKKDEEAKALADAKAQADEAAKMDAEWEKEMNPSSKTKKEIEKEINQYTLPDGDEVNWDGLNH